jgi:hypothetical protein
VTTRDSRAGRGCLPRDRTPGAVSLDQAALQAVGQPRDDAPKMREPFIEIAAQPLQFVVVAEIFRPRSLVEFRREGVIWPPRGSLAPRESAASLARRLLVAEFAVAKVSLMEACALSNALSDMSSVEA